MRTKSPKTEKELIKKYNKLSLIFGVPGIIGRIFFLAILLKDLSSSNPEAYKGIVLFILSFFCFFIGTIYYLKAKGRSDWWGLFAFTPLFIGLIVLLRLKKRPLIIGNPEPDIIYSR
jgi:hypothetical protein